MRVLLVCMMCAAAATSAAQSGFYARFIDFSHEDNAHFEHPPSENLATILLDGYLRGKLKAYKYAVAHDILKYAPIPADQLPATWNDSTDYYWEDMVFYKNNVYVANTDIVKHGTPPDSGRYWQNVDMHGTPISTWHHFPLEADTTTKSFLLSSLVEDAPMIYDPWVEGIEYFNADRVAHEGKNYAAKRNNFAGVVPGTNEEFWTLLSSRITLYAPSDLNVFKILYHYQINGRDTIHTPQMISVNVLDRTKEVYREVGLNFYANDVLNFLETIDQPVLYQSDLGLMEGRFFLFDERTKLNFVNWVKAKISSKEIKPDKRTILSDAEYTLFLNAKTEDITASAWYPIQNPATREITIIAGKLNSDYEYYTIPTLSIPFKSIEKLLVSPPRKTHFYREIFTSRFLSSTIDSVHMDSINALPALNSALKGFRGWQFDQMHFDRIDSDPLLQTAASSLWDLALAKKVGFKTYPYRFPCRYNWAGTKITWDYGTQIAGRDVSLSHEQPLPELPKRHMTMKEIGIVYRMLPAGKFSPLQIVFSFEDEPHTDLIDYHLDWSDAMNLADGDPKLKEFIDSVNKGTLKFKQTATTYNLMMTR